MEHDLSFQMSLDFGIVYTMLMQTSCISFISFCGIFIAALEIIYYSLTMYFYNHNLLFYVLYYWSEKRKNYTMNEHVDGNEWY